MKNNLLIKEKVNAKPFIKWAGGKTQILDELDKRIPSFFKQTGIIDRYVEPFVGGGAFFFYLKNKYIINEAFLFDLNHELIIGYEVIKNNHIELINKLKELENQYLSKNDKEREYYFYKIRNIYNKQIKKVDYENYNKTWINRASYLIFLNKTCFNGLYRQNKNGEFNVPFGRYKNPLICNKDNINAINTALHNTQIYCGDFNNSSKYIKKNTLVYLDPPYRPLNNTSSFTSYFKMGFDDKDQKRLAKFYTEMAKKGAYLILSNSDPKNENKNDNFFEELYKQYNLERILASRMINCNGNKRGKINELIITNF